MRSSELAKVRGLQAVKLENDEVVWVEPREILDAE
jgi:hypothetical protein